MVLTYRGGEREFLGEGTAKGKSKAEGLAAVSGSPLLKQRVQKEKGSKIKVTRSPK